MTPKTKFKQWLNDRQERTALLKEAAVVTTMPAQPEVKTDHLQSLDDLKKERANDYDYDADQEPYVPVGVHGLLAATEKLLAVNRGLATTDERDSLVFKKVFPTNKILSERIRTDVGGIRKKILRMAAHRKNLSPLGPLTFDDYTEKQLVSNPLSSPLEEINPMQLVESARRITQMGPGGIKNSSSITEGMQNVSASQFGFVDALSGPESERIGVDARTTWGTKYGSDGRIYQIFRNARTGKMEYKCAADLDGMVVKLPD